MTASHLLNSIAVSQQQQAKDAAKTKSMWRLFGQQVRKERKCRGIRLIDFAQRLGVTGAMVSYMESGAREWGMDRAKQAVHILTRPEQWPDV